jgi:hypothetical protein
MKNLNLVIFIAFLMLPTFCKAMDLGGEKDQKNGGESNASTLPGANTVYLAASTATDIYYVYLREQPGQLLKAGELKIDLMGKPAAQGQHPGDILGREIGRYLGFFDGDGNLTTPDPAYLMAQLQKLGRHDRFELVSGKVSAEEYINLKSKGKTPLSGPDSVQDKNRFKYQIHDSWNHVAGELYLAEKHRVVVKNRALMLLELIAKIKAQAEEEKDGYPINAGNFCDIVLAEAAEDEDARHGDFHLNYNDPSRRDVFMQFIFNDDLWTPHKHTLGAAFKDSTERLMNRQTCRSLFADKDQIEPFKKKIMALVEDIVRNWKLRDYKIEIPDSRENLDTLLNKKKKRIEGLIAELLAKGEQLPEVRPKM